MIRNILISMFFLFSFIFSTNARPLHITTFERLTELRRITDDSIKNGALSEEDIAYVFFCIDKKESTLSSVSFWLIGEQTNDVDVLHQKLLSVNRDIGDMALAFLTIALEKLEYKSRQEPWKPGPEIRNTENPFLKLEIARELMGIDKEDGKNFLEQLSRDELSLVKYLARDFYLKMDSIAPEKRYVRFSSIASSFHRPYATVVGFVMGEYPRQIP